MNNSHKILAEKYQTIQEQTGKPEMKVYKYGTKKWYLNGKFHRTDGPAIEYTSGTKVWYLNGKLHRTDGPAIEYANGDKAWFLNGKEYTEEEFLKLYHGKDLMDLAY